MVRDVAHDLGEAEPELVGPTVRRFLDMITGEPGLRAGDRLRLRQEGATAARQGRPLAALMDGYLSTAWVTWDHALGLVPPLRVPAMRELGAALLRAGDQIAAEVSDGYTSAERAIAAGVQEVAFDRSGFKFHGRVKALADAAREHGLKF